MVRAVTHKYGVWLCGYYDDFLSAKASGFDDNQPDNSILGDYNHWLTHYGNPLNGEATLNPRYRWAIADRAQSSAAAYKFAPASLQYYHNKGMFEWLSIDIIRNYPQHWQGRAQLQYPDGHTNAARYRTGNSGSDSFQIFSNGNDTSSSYIVPTGDIDSSFGRATMRGLGYITDYSNKEAGLSNWVASSGGNSGNDDDILEVRRAHLTGRWSGEKVKQAVENESPQAVFAPLESPSGQPFLTVQSWDKAGSSSVSSRPTVFYNGGLNSRDTGDYLHFRLATRAYNGAGTFTPKITIKAGFPDTGLSTVTLNAGAEAVSHYEDGLQGTAAISFDVDLSGYSTLPLLYNENNTKITYTNDNSWIDIDVWIDYDNNKYQVYQDGVAKGSLTSFATSRVAKDMFGWEIYVQPPNGTDDAVTYLMLDRVALYRPLTDSPRDWDFPGIYSFNYESGVNQISTLSINLEDSGEHTNSTTRGMNSDDYNYHITNIFKSEILNDWWMVLFAGAGETGQTDIARIDRPVWRGFIENISLKESNSGKRTIQIQSKDSISILTKQVLLWEVGQGKVNDSEGSSPYWAFEAEGMQDLMYLGCTKLKELAGNVGYESGNSYKPRDDQRTQLYSGHPIQMYNNEELYGPNDIEDDYEGMGIDYIIHDGTHLRFFLSGNPGFAVDDELTIGGTGNAAYDGKTVDITAVEVVDGKQIVNVANGTNPGELVFTDKKANDIVYAGQYIGESIAWDDPEYNWNDVNAATDLEAVSGWYRYFHLVFTRPTLPGVGSIDVVNPGGGYSSAMNYYTLIDGVKEHQGDLTISGGGAGAGFTAAEATWFSDGYKITKVEMRENGSGYTSTPTVTHSNIQGTGTERRGNILKYTAKATGTNSIAAIQASASYPDVRSDANTYTQVLKAFNAAGNRLASDCAVFHVNSLNGTISAQAINLFFGGYNYDPDGSGTDAVTNILIERVGGSTYTLDIIVDEIQPDATFYANLAGEATTENYTFLMKSDPELLPGEQFVISGKAVTGHTTTELDKIEGKHLVKSVKKVLNYHQNAYSIGDYRYMWQVQTYTPYTNEEFGNWLNSNGLLVTSSDPTTLGWSKVTGGTLRPNPSSVTEDISNRAIHARLMRDLPMSLWFQYHFGKINYDINPTSTNISMNGAISATDTEIKITQATYNAIPSYGLAEIVRAVPAARYDITTEVRDIFIYQCKYQLGSDYYIGGIKYISTDHATQANSWTSAITAGAVDTTINFLNINNNYKHLWVLWSDMRNDGEANADGGKREKVFGLQYPTHDNYTVKLMFEDQFDDDGGYETFAELKQGTDIDIWEIDATSDPVTGGAFSYPLDYGNMVAFNQNDITTSGAYTKITETGHGLVTGDKVGLFNCGTGWDGVYDVTKLTNDTFRLSHIYPGSKPTASNAAHDRFFYAKVGGSFADLSTYRNWHEKAGSFLIVDASKFFNLNTLANEGSFSKTSGGETSLGDYYAVKEGDPVLIDTYWKQATSSDMTTGDNYAKHENMGKLSVAITTLPDVTEGQFWLEPDDISLFDGSGLGKIVGRDDEEEINTEFFYTWNGKIGTEVTGTFETIAVTPFDTKWVCTDNQGGFTSDMEGAYIQNVTKPLVAGVGDSWKTNFIQQYWYRIKEVISATVIHVERVSYLHINPFGASGIQSQAGENYSDYVTGLHGNYLRQVDIDDGWANTNTYKIIKQIFNVNLDSATNVITDTTYSPRVIEEEFAMKQSSYGRRVEAHCRTGILNSDYTTVRINNTVATEYAFRLMMHITGYAESQNSGTFFEHDKFRMLWSAALLNSWWTKTRLPMSFDINNIPNTTKMTTYNDISSNDVYGSVYRAGNKKMSEILRGVQKGSGAGKNNGLTTTFSYQVGRDNKLEFRNKFNSGYQFTRENVKVSSMKINNSGVISNVRVHYNDGNSFVDFPKTSMGDITKWKIIQHPEVLSDKEAEAIAQKEYHKHKANDIQISITPLRNTGQGDVMLDGGRYGYIQDAHIALQGNGDQTKGTGWCWTKIGTGGSLHPGMVNALDGNLGAVVTTNTKNTRYGTSKIDATANTDRNVAVNDNYYWYGSNSLSHAIQIVNISKDVNKVSADTGEKLRVVLALKPNQTLTAIDNCQFRLYLLDCDFYDAAATTDYAPTLKGIIKSKSEKDMKHSGFYEITLPSTYGTGTVIVSFNAEYCRDLLRSRCGNPAQTAHATANYILDNCVQDIISASGGSSIELDTGNAVNEHSIFPLGYRPYPEFSGGSSHKDGRLLWYAPSLCVVDDLMYVPASYVSYTDAGMDFSAENLVIQKIKWQAASGRAEDLILQLERDESRSSDGLLPYLLADPGNYPKPQPIMGTSLRPPSDSNTTDITSIDLSPVGGNNPGTGNSGSFTNIQSPQNIDDFGRGLVNVMNGTMSLPDSDLTAQSGHHILGQPRGFTTPSWMRGMTGGLRLPVVAGAAISNENSFELPGIGKEKQGQGEAPSPARDAYHAVQIDIQTPPDATTNELNITGITNIGIGRDGGGNTGILHISIKCLETDASINKSISVIPAMNQNNIELIPTTLLNGVSTPGNTIRITVSRTPGQMGDTAIYSTISVSNFTVNFNRAAFSASSPQNQFIPYR